MENRSDCTAPHVQCAVTMPVMKLYRPLPDPEPCTGGIVGTAAALRVTTSERGRMRRTKETGTRNGTKGRVDFGVAKKSGERVQCVYSNKDKNLKTDRQTKYVKLKICCLLNK